MDPTISIRPPPDLLDRVMVWAHAHNMTRHSAILSLIELGLRGGPAQVTVPLPDPPKHPTYTMPPKRRVTTHVDAATGRFTDVTVGPPVRKPGSLLKTGKGR